MWASGAGKTNPAGNDGQIALSGSLPTPQLPVTVMIDNQLAEVLYAGAAPGMVQGIIQLNVRVPAAASTGQVPVVLQVGTYGGPNTGSVVLK